MGAAAASKRRKEARRGLTVAEGSGSGAWPGRSHRGRGLGGGTARGRGRAAARPAGERAAGGWPGAPAFAAAAAEVRVSRCGGDLMGFAVLGVLVDLCCGGSTIQKMATRILSLTSSSSGCERNWSGFEGVSTYLLIILAVL
jgi:hypothetical protein